MGVKILIVDKFLSDNLINSATYYVNYGITLVDWESTINKNQILFDKRNLH